MAAVTIRNLSDEVHRAIKVRAANHNRSAEAEIRDILETVVMPKERVKLGSALWAISREFGMTDEEYEAFQLTRDRTPAEPMTFE
jgi:antitoxin FitA